nr:uncharacterized protein LOC117225525 [Megalopta genalis]
MNFVRVDQLAIFLILIYTGCHEANDLVNNTAGTLVEDNEVLYFRLPKAIVPNSYSIALIPSMEGDTEITGISSIEASVQEETDTIILNVGNITIDLMTVTLNNTVKLNPSDVKHDMKTEKYTIKLENILKKGSNITLDFNYFATLRNDMIGFYKSAYIDSKGKVRWLASTQFQTKHARHVFPCFDEPSFKATFKIKILRPKEYLSLSNMPRDESAQTPPIGSDEMVWDIFLESIPMSTYLVAFTVSDFSNLTTGNFSVWARSDAIDQAKYAAKIGPNALRYLSDLFQQEYQLPKMDMVAVPDFAAGAMENWGLITYRESRMLYDQSTSSDIAQQRVASVIVHELAHMWFGNQITPEWWSYLWLSEAFARYFEYFATAQVEKSWNMEKQFVVEQIQTGMAADGLESSEPMTRNVQSFTQLAGIGDTITYNKGGSIVRMMSLVFGNDIFVAGLRNYLQNNKEKKVAEPENLWKELQNEVNRQNKQLAAPVNQIMSTWTTQAGFPVLNVVIENGKAHCWQYRFLLRNLKATPINSTWWIPITWASESNPNFNNVNVTRWISKEQDTLDLGTGHEWVVLNVQSAGFYRVNYDNASWYRILDVLNSKNYQNISDVNRAAIVDDLLNLARAGFLKYKTALDGLQYIKNETNYLPFKSAFSGLTYLDRRFSGNNKYYEEFKGFVLSLIVDIYENLGYVDRSNDDRLTVLLRSELNKWACNYGHEGCTKYFIEEFRQWKISNKLSVKPNQRAVAFCTGIRYGTKDDWEFLWNQYFNSNSAAEQSDIMQALGCTQDSSLRERYLLNAVMDFEKSRIRRQDSTSVFSAISSSGYNGAVYILDFVQKHHTKITEYYNGTENIASILSTASQGFSTQKAVDQFENLIKTHQSEFKDILSSLNKSLEIAKYELLWFDKYKNDIISWIRNYNKENGTDPRLSDYRLPENLVPLTYSIHMKPFIDTFKYEGEVDITAEVKQRTNTIVLHCLTKIVEADVRVSVGDSTIDIVDIATTYDYDFLELKLGKELTVGEIVNIHIPFSGMINDIGKGFYRSWYTTDSGEIRWLATTQMEPVYARTVFPCFDEPALKATFKMKVTVQEGYDAISNTQMDTVIRHPDNQKTITFKETPKMSTYLVVLVVSDFEGVTSYERYTVWARSNAVHQAHYALSVMQPLVKFYENNLNISYQLPKLEMVALPDFVSGAMENWGVLTYKERNLLYLDRNSTLPSKQAITNVISHEIAHQWFGNMVSPAWWKYTWLNEGFARYFQYLGTATVMIDWSLDAQFVVDHLHTALSVDSSITSHPMTHDVDSPTEIKGMFDTISYAKAASVIRMVRASFGDVVFYQALSKYLNKQQYGVATPENLFDAFKEEIADVNMKNSIHDIMNSWTTQPGYPVVKVSFDFNEFKLNQERFLINGTDYRTVWNIPITWTSLNEPNFNDTKPKHWLNKMSDSIDLLINKTDLFIFNIRQSGYYRVNYDDNYWDQIIKFLKSEHFDKIDEINRAAIIDDLMNFARNGNVNNNIMLFATQYLVNETSYIPLKAFFTGLTYLRRQFEGRDAYGAFKRYVTGIITPIYERYGFTDNPKDSHTTKLLKIQLRKWACEMEVGNCETDAAELFLKRYIRPNYRSTVYCVIAKKNANWQTLMMRYNTSTMASDKALILQSLACTTEPKFLEELLLKAISVKLEVRKEDSSAVFSYVIEASLEGAKTVMDFIKKNYDKMFDYYGGYSEIKSILNTLAKRVIADKPYSEFVELINWLRVKDPSASDSFIAAKNAADNERKWAEKYIPEMHRWLEVNYPDTNYRLPKLYSPLKYNITISPDIKEGHSIFNGKVQIEMQSLEPTSRIVVNSNGLTITLVKVYNSQGNLTIGEELNVLGEHVLNEETEMLTVFTEHFVQNKAIILEIEYTGILNNDMVGFYRSYYEDSSKKIHWLATTQFQATYARMAFPCFDEPAYKAKFTINIERPVHYTALSNMPSIKVTPSNDPDRMWETFNESVPMSTYLVAFVVSDFKPVRSEDTNVKVWSAPHMASSGDYAQTAAKRFLEYLHNMTDIEYALPKLDLVAIPDFSQGAMENWGLATFRDYGIQYNDTVTSAKFKDYITTIIAHELTHMWFGNLVTCDWWEYTWLNEGFAEYIQWIISDILQPSHKFNELFVVNELQEAMLEDDYTTSHPMNKPVTSPYEIEDIFDGITYGKGSSMLRMVEHSFGKDVFLKAIKRYLRQHKYNTTTPKDLWQAFDEVINETHVNVTAGISVENIMDAWTNEAGYPIVYADRDNQIVKLTQKRFTYTSTGNPKQVPFWIPITVATESTPNFVTTSTNFWLERMPITIQVYNSTWFLLNVQQTGFYRVKYDNNSWNSLVNALYQQNYSNIYVTNRAQLVDDALNLARASEITYDEAFKCTDYLRDEMEYLPWKAFFNGINFLLQRSEGQQDNVSSLIKSYILHLTSKIYTSLDFEDSTNDDHLRQLSRELILTWRCKAEDKDCTKKTNDLFIEYQMSVFMGLPNTISVNARAAVYCTMMRIGDYNDWTFMWQRYGETNFASEKKTILEALGCTTDNNTLLT